MLNEGVFTFKLLYGWNNLNANIWLPSLAELVGYDLNHAWAAAGVYYSAMQGMNTSVEYYTDAQGGTQFAYFTQFNANGGGEKLWNACNQQITWLRSTDLGNHATAWHITNSERFDVPVVTASRAVHPAV